MGSKTSTPISMSCFQSSQRGKLSTATRIDSGKRAFRSLHSSIHRSIRYAGAFPDARGRASRSMMIRSGETRAPLPFHGRSRDKMPIRESKSIQSSESVAMSVRIKANVLNEEGAMDRDAASRMRSTRRSERCTEVGDSVLTQGSN